MATSVFDDIRANGEQVLEEIRQIIKQGNARKIIIRNKRGKTLFEAPLTVSSAGIGGLFLLHPILSTVAAFIMFTRDIRIEVERYEGTPVDENELEADYVPIEDD